LIMQLAIQWWNTKISHIIKKLFKFTFKEYCNFW
jgi:hypothetical protein